MPKPDHEIVIIGAGLSGLGMAIRLRQAGISDFVIFERANDIGGTWRDNTYPGVAVDIPAQAYQFSFDLNPAWSRTFAPGREVKAYVDGCADRFDVRRHVHLGTEVTERVWDEETHVWRLGTTHGRVTARFVISAIGAFVDPKTPELPGLPDFDGAVLHSAAWDHDVELAGRRVAVIGTGASAVQIVPEIAAEVSHLDVFQRTPIWISPRVDLPTGRLTQALFRRFPRVQDAVRRTVTRGVEVLLVGGILNQSRVLKAVAAFDRSIWYRTQVRDPQTRRRLTPSYPLGCKRPSISSAYLKTFNRANVDLVVDPIERVVRGGIRTVDGVEHPADVLVLATGFRMATDPENFKRTPVRGRDGFDLATFLANERPRSYESISLPGLPNHFMIFGPYGWTGGTWHELVETASIHIVRVIQEAHRRDATAVEVSEEATDAWTERMRGVLADSLLTPGNCATSHTYYLDANGDAPFVRPTSAAEARRACRTFPLDDYRYERLTA